MEIRNATSESVKDLKLGEMGNKNKCPIAVMIRDEKILSGYRHYTKINTKHDWKEISVWTLPGGRCEDGETLGDALKREIQEEVGITKFDVTHYIGEVSGAKDGDFVSVFFCTTKQNYKLIEPDKFSEWRWIPKGKYIEGECYSGFNPMARKLIVDFLLKH